MSGPPEPEVEWNPQAAAKVPSSLRTILLQHNNGLRAEKAQFLTHLTIGGLRYTISSKHFGNSCVLLNHNSTPVGTPGVIGSILRIQGATGTVHTLLAVRRYKPLPPPYNGNSQFRTIGASIWSSELGGVEIVKPEIIRAHCASLAIEGDIAGVIAQGGTRKVIVFISLEKVSPPVVPDNDSGIVDISVLLRNLDL